MDPILHTVQTGLPILLAHFATTIGILVVASAIYVIITPHHELRLVRKGNIAAALSLSGAVLGLAIPLAFTLASSINVYDILIWGAVILSLQLATYFIIDWILHGVSKSIENEEFAPVIFLVAVKLSVAIISAAAIAG